MYRRLASLLGVFLLTLTTLGAMTSSAAASSEGVFACHHPGWSDKDGAQTRINQDRFYLRDGPYADCNSIMVITPEFLIRLDCYYVNLEGNTWSHVTVDGVYGWIHDIRLVGGGSFVRC